MSTFQGVAALPAAVAADPSLAAFAAIWRRVLAWDAADGLRPFSGAHTALAVTDDGLRRLTPCDVSDPFIVDRQLQYALIRRHVLTEAVPPADGWFSAGGRVLRLDGEEITLSRQGAEPAFGYGDEPPVVGKLVSGDDAGAVVYVVDRPFVSCDEVSDAIGRHPQENPFHQPEPELEPEPEPEPETPQ